MLCEIPPVLYQNRYCTQENFDVVASGYDFDENMHYHANIIKVRHPRVLTVEKYVYSKKYSDVISTVSIGSFVCTVSSCKDIKENFILGEQYFGKQ